MAITSIRSLRASFEEETNRLRPFLYKLALRLARNEVDAQDLMHDAFVRALEHASKLPPDSQLRGWLGTILWNRFIDLCRARARTQPEPLWPETCIAATAVLDTEPKAAWERVTPAAFEAALERLEPDLQQVIVLYFWERKSYKAIAQILDMPVGTVGSRLTRARKLLRELLSSELEEPE